MAKQWQIRTHDSGRVASLENAARISPIVAHLLLCRGVDDPTTVPSFLAPKLSDLRDPETLPGVPAAADRVHAAIRDGRRIVIYGDYDCDGMTGTAVLYRCLTLLSADVGYYVPNRLEEGYGLNDDALTKLAERGAQVVISVDCGIASVAQAQTARRLGLELIITDHHQMGDELPDAAAIVHPRLPGTSYPFSGLCGAGVAFKLAWAICCRASDSKKVSPRMREFLLSAIGITAIGTVADVVPLVDENRVIVRYGLTSLLERPPLGLQKLMEVAKLTGKSSLGSDDIGFGMAPRLNAAGRLGQAQLGVELLVTDSEERATALAEYINELNGSRDSLERSVYLAAKKQVKEQLENDDPPAFVLAGRGWHAGVIGIVAGRLADKHNRPVVMISQDELGVKPGTGSARSACGLNLYEALQQCSERLLAHGGHAAAAGLKIDDAHVDAFRIAFCEHVAGEISVDERDPIVHIDVEAPFTQLTLNTVKQIEQLAPFGEANPRPILCATNVEIAAPPQHLGNGDRHITVRLKQQNVRLRAVGFGQGEWLEELIKVEGPIDVAYRPVVNEYQGWQSVELHLVDWRPSHVAAVAPAGVAS